MRDLVPWAALALVALRLKPVVTLPGLAVLLLVRRASEWVVDELAGPEPSGLEPRSVAALAE